MKGLPPLASIVPPMGSPQPDVVHPLHPPPNISNTPPVVPVSDMESAPVIPASDTEQTPPPTPPVNTPDIAPKSKPPALSQKTVLPLIQASAKIMKQAQIYGQVYNQLQQNYMQVANKYQNQLMELLPSIALLTAKTPLSSITDDDLTQHIEQLYTMMPFQSALANTDKLIKGYYISKINGVNTNELDTIDLMQIADNPAFAQAMDENLTQFLGRLGGVLQLKMQTALQEAGMIKDMYQEKLKEMQMQGQILHSMAYAIIGMAKGQEEAYYHSVLENEMIDRLGLEAQNMALRESMYQQSLAMKEQHYAALDNYLNEMAALKNKDLQLRSEELEKKKSGGVNKVGSIGNDSKKVTIQKIPHIGG